MFKNLWKWFVNRSENGFIRLQVNNISFDIFEDKTIAYEAAFPFKGHLNVFKGVAIIYQDIVAAFTFLSLQLNVLDKTCPYCALVKCSLGLGDWCLLCINLILWKLQTLSFFKQLTKDLIVLCILGLLGLNVVMNGNECFHLTAF